MERFTNIIVIALVLAPALTACQFDDVENEVATGFENDTPQYELADNNALPDECPECSQDSAQEPFDMMVSKDPMQTKSTGGWYVNLGCAWGASSYSFMADFDGDGRDDIASAAGGNVYMHLSRDGEFDNQIWPIVASWSQPQWTRQGDFNGDGKADIASFSGGNAFMKLSTGTSFSSETWSISPSWGSHLYTWVADFNGDGKDDVASAHGGNIFVKLSTGSGFSNQTWSVPGQWGQWNYTWVGDFNGDGKADIASGYGSTVLVHLSTGSAFTSHTWNINYPWGDAGYTWVADFDGDGKDDIASGYGTVIHRHRSTGTSFESTQHGISGVWFGGGYAWAADFTGDGKADIATASGGRVYIYESTGDDFREALWLVPTAWGAPSYTWIGDFNGDLTADISSADGCTVHMKTGPDEIDLAQPDALTELIERFTPTVYFHPHELYFTDSVSNYLSTVDLYGGEVLNQHDYDTFNNDNSVPFTGDWSTYGLVNGVELVSQYVADNLGVPVADQSYWLAATSNTNLAGSLTDTEVYIKADTDPAGERLKIQYWYFYPYNGPGRFEFCYSGLLCSDVQAAEVGRHEGDWENVNVELYVDTGMIASVTISGHGDDKERTIYLGWEDQTHPIVYSAKYSHAFYWTTGRHEYHRPWSLDYGIGTASVDLFDLAGATTVHRVNNTGDYRIISSNISSLAIQPPEWIDYTDRWGFYERLSHTEVIGGVYPYTFEEVGGGPRRDWSL